MRTTRHTGPQADDPAHQESEQPIVAGVADRVLGLQRSAGNAAVAAMIARRDDPGAGQEAGGGLWAGLTSAADNAAMAIGLKELTIADGVGRGGENQPLDVAQVRARLAALGYLAADGLDGLAEAIARYQSEVVGLKYPDGRIDPGGKTIKALAAMKRASAPAAMPAAEPVAPAEPPAPAAPAPVGTRGPLADPALDQLVATAKNPEVDAAAAELAGLEKKFKGLKHSLRREEEGKGRDELVEGFRSLRTKVAAFDKAGLDAKTTAALRAQFYRAMNDISPFYFQGVNIILEFDRLNKTTGKLEHVWNTCNITSTAMALEGLGKSAADYKYKSLIPPIAEVFEKDVNERATGKVDASVAGLRLPDYLAMAAIVWQMGYKTGTREEILAGGNKAFNAVPSAQAVMTLAKDFGANVKHRYFSTDAGAKKAGMADLKAYGAKHHKRGDVQAEAKTKLIGVEAQLERETDEKKRAKLEKEKARLEGKIGKDGALSDAAIESKLPLEQYKEAVLSQLGPDVDGGRQIVVGQHNHFVRLQSIDDEFVVKDDPGGFTRGNMRATWEEARAMGLFWQSISIG